MKDYLSVKEFAKLSGIESTTLRYWDGIGLFSPAYRAPDNNYRYYVPQQIIAVNFITVMSALNVPLKTIGEVDAGRDPEKILELIEQQERMLDREMRRLQECYAVIHIRSELITGGLKIDESEISVTEQPERAMVRGPRNRFKEDDKFYEPFMNFCRQAEELRVNLNLPVGTIYDGMESFLKVPEEPNYFFSLDPCGNRKLEGGPHLVGYYRGNYGEFGDLPGRMAAYADAHGLKCAGAPYAICLHDEICVKDPSRYLVQVAVPVAKE